LTNPQTDKQHIARYAKKSQVINLLQKLMYFWQEVRTHPTPLVGYATGEHVSFY